MNIANSAKARWLLVFWTCGAAILILALMPTVPHMATTGWDKSNHALAFLVLAYLGCRAYPDRTAVVFAGCVLYGGLIEVLQSFTTYRYAEWADLAADAIGVVVGRALIAIRWPRTS